MLLATALFATSAVAATPVKLPPGEAPAAWRPAFKMADLSLAEVGSESAVLIEDRGESWVLWARDDAGIVREVEVATPVTSGDREDVAWLIVSLLSPSPTIDLGLPPRRVERMKPVPAAVVPVEPEVVEVEVVEVEVVEVEVAEPEPEPEVPPSSLLTLQRPPEQEPHEVALELAHDHEPYRRGVMPFASFTASTDARIGALPAPSFQVAAGFDIVGRVRAGVSVGSTAFSPVSWDPTRGSMSLAGSVEAMGFGSVGLDARGRVRLGVAVGVRNMQYVPLAPGTFHIGSGETIPTIRVEASYGFRIARSLAAMPTLGVQVDVLDDTPVSTRPGTMFPVSIRIGLRFVALRDVDFRLAPPPPPPFSKTN